MTKINFSMISTNKNNNMLLKYVSSRTLVTLYLKSKISLSLSVIAFDTQFFLIVFNFIFIFFFFFLIFFFFYLIFKIIKKKIFFKKKTPPPPPIQLNKSNCHI